MKSFINNNPAFIFILTIYALISIFLVGFHDYSSDSSLYSVRALGWTDYMGSSQKGPVQWLGHSTWWSSLSFQDAPPVVFGMQYIFFRLFGGATSSAQILFLLAGVILLCSVYFYVQKIKDTEIAVWSSVAFGVSSLALWSTTSGNLEGVQSLFIILNFLTTSLYIKYNKDKYLYFAIVFMGLALMSKYTSIFIIPSFLASLYIWKSRQEKSSAERDIKISKYFYSTLLLFIIILPTFIYNFHLYKLRGNFDTALSAMVGMENELNRSMNFDFVRNIFDIVTVLFSTGSFLYVALCLISFLYIVIKSQQRKTDIFEDSLIIYISMFFIMLGFMGGGARWLPLFIPFFSIALGLLIVEIRKKYSSRAILFLFIFILLFEFAYSVNTNLFLNPVGRVGVFSSNIRNSNAGFNELEEYLNKELSPLGEKYRVSKAEELELLAPNPIDVEDKIIMYDGRVNWFAKWWYLEKYFVYYKIKVFSYDNGGIRNTVFPKNSIENSNLKGSGKTVYFIEAVDPRVMNADISSSLGERLLAFSQDLQNKNIPFVDIVNKHGKVAFKVFKITF